MDLSVICITLVVNVMLVYNICLRKHVYGEEKGTDDRAMLFTIRRELYFCKYVVDRKVVHGQGRTLSQGCQGILQKSDWTPCQTQKARTTGLKIIK